MSKTQLEKVKEFNNAFNVPHVYGPPSLEAIEDRIDFRMGLIAEEFIEIVDAVYGSKAAEKLQSCWSNLISNKDNDEKRRDIVGLSGELADLIFVINGFADEANIPLDDVFDEINRANMSKLDDNGRPILSDGVTPDRQGKIRPKGKILKGPNYKPANIAAVLEKEH